MPVFAFIFMQLFHKQMIQSFTCIFKIVFNYESEVGPARQGFRAAVEFVFFLRKNLDTRKDGHFCIILCVFGHLSSTTN